MSLPIPAYLLTDKTDDEVIREEAAAWWAHNTEEKIAASMSDKRATLAKIEAEGFMEIIGDEDRPRLAWWYRTSETETCRCNDAWKAISVVAFRRGTVPMVDMRGTNPWTAPDTWDLFRGTITVAEHVKRLIAHGGKLIAGKVD